MIVKLRKGQVRSCLASLHTCNSTYFRCLSKYVLQLLINKWHIYLSPWKQELKLKAYAKKVSKNFVLTSYFALLDVNDVLSVLFVLLLKCSASGVHWELFFCH